MIGGDDSTGVKTRRRLTGIAFLLVLCLLVYLSIAAFQKKFTPASMVTLLTGSVGNEMHPHADVKLRGAVIGEVRTISANGSGARLRLAMQPGQLRRVPANVTAQMLPTTLFGERYVALIPPAAPSPDRLTAGATISQDRSSNAIELERVLDNVLPLLTAVRPQDLASTLTAVAQALSGRGMELGETAKQIEQFLAKLNPKLPELNRDIAELVKVLNTYTVAAPDIVQALADFTTTSRTIAEQRANLSSLYSSVTGASQNLTEFLRQNSGNIIALAATGRPTLSKLARYSPSFPCTLQTLADFVPNMDRVLGKGTNEHGMHVTVNTVPSRGKYLPGKDTPVYRPGNGPHCYPVPFTGGSGSAKATTKAGGRSVAPAGGPAEQVTAGGLGPANSPGENTLVNELVAPSIGAAPTSLPDWSSVLVGPVYRGVEVRLK